MSRISNKANLVEEVIEVNRAQIEHRAKWMGLIYDEMKKAGINAEPIIRAAIRRCGRSDGERIKLACKDTQDCGEFKNAFLNDVGLKTFGMVPVGIDRDNLGIDFHYCALVSAWQKLGFDDETCALLCDIAMEGDRGIAETMGLKLDLQETIAQGCPVCKLRFHK